MHLHSNPPLAFLNISQREMETYSHTKTLHTKVQLRLWQKLDIIFTSVYELVNGECIYKVWKIHTNAGPWGCPWQPGTALYPLELFCFIQKSFQILLVLPTKKKKNDKMLDSCYINLLVLSDPPYKKASKQQWEGTIYWYVQHCRQWLQPRN